MIDHWALNKRDSHPPFIITHALFSHLHHAHPTTPAQTHPPRSQRESGPTTGQALECLLGHLFHHTLPQVLSWIFHLVTTTTRSQPFELFLVLFQLWLYSEQYRGALFLTTLLTTKIEQLGLKGHIDLLYLSPDPAPNDWQY